MGLLASSAVKKHAVAKDGGDVTVTIDARHLGELSVLIPAGCFDELISALTRAKTHHRPCCIGYRGGSRGGRCNALPRVWSCLRHGRSRGRDCRHRLGGGGSGHGGGGRSLGAQPA